MFDEPNSSSPSLSLWEESISAEKRAKEARWAYIMSPEFARDMEKLFQGATRRAIEEQRQVESTPPSARCEK